MFRIVDYVTRGEVKPCNLVFTGEMSPWEVEMDLEVVKTKVDFTYFREAPSTVSKYLPFLPIKDYHRFVGLREGGTPLIKSKRIGVELGVKLYFKVESKNPTGSFKDRGSAVEISVARELGASGIAVASTGNMAASCCCYAAAAQIPCYVFVPKGVPTSKLAQVISYGGRVIQVEGDFNTAASLAKTVAEHLGLYLAGDYAFRIEGQKTAAFELVDQFFYQVPDAIFVPMGGGTNISAYAKGFREFFGLGLIEKQPRLIGVQASGASAIVDSFLKGEKLVEPLSKVDTICSAIGVADPLDGLKALDAIYASNGMGVKISDKEALFAHNRLAAEEGLFVECSSAVTLAALSKCCRDGSIGKGEKVVCVLTGDGLKDPQPLLDATPKATTIRPSLTDFLAFYKSEFLEEEAVTKPR